MRLFKLPSVARLAAAARLAVGRFPWTVLAALVAVVAGWQLVDGGADEERWIRYIAAAVVGLASFTAVTLWAERKWGRGGVTLGISLVLGGLLPLFIWVGWPGWTEQVQAMRTVQIVLLAHLLVACLPFLGRDEPNAFWQYNRHLLERWVLAGIYAAVLFAGLALALAALDNLFGLDIDPEWYGRTWLVITFLVHPLIVLSNIPDDLGLLEDEDTRLHGMVILAQYVLVPLTAIYLLILLAYLVKILVTGQWPSGWIGWLVSGVATVGILTVLLVSPPSREGQANWVRAFEKWLWPGLVPAGIMLAMAVGKRVGQYGWTEPRYFLAVLTAWLIGIALVFMLRRPRSLIAIPASLAVLAAITAIGPWGAYGTGERSQLNRLASLLSGTDTEMAAEDRSREVSAAVRYMLEVHGAEPMQAWLTARGVEAPAFTDSLVESDRHKAEQVVVEALGETHVGRYAGIRDGSIWRSWSTPDALDVSGYDLLLPIQDAKEPDSTLTGMHARVAEDGRGVEVRDGGQLLLAVPLGGLIDTLAGSEGPRSDQPEFPGFDAATDSLRARLLLDRLSVRDSAGVRWVESAGGSVLVGGQTDD